MSAKFQLPPIVIDTREQKPLVFPAVVRTRRGTLHTGDYSIAGFEDEFTVEKKSLSDLVRTVIHHRERFERELERMRSFRFRRLLVTVPYCRVATGRYDFSRATPRSVVASVNAFEVRYGVPATYAYGDGEAATRLLNWAWYFVRERRLEAEGEGKKPVSGAGWRQERLSGGRALSEVRAVSGGRSGWRRG